MILSMTGYGTAERVDGDTSYALEIRSLNHRYLKLNLKLPDLLQFAEPDVDKLLRRRLSRGAVTYTLRVRTGESSVAGTLSTATLQHYLGQLSRVPLPDGMAATVDLGALVTLPGVCQTANVPEDAQDELREIVEDLTSRAMDSLTEMRRVEGRALQEDIRACCDAIRSLRSRVEELAPTVVEEYHDRLASRVNTLMQRGGFELEAEGLMREVAIYAERSDIGEELTRLGAHLDQFAALCERDEPVGRTLDFLTQELLREANTIASKSNDAAITQDVVAMKGLIDRIKEQVQNVE